jgi:hypothetical protein
MNVNGIEDWIKSAENVVTGAGRVRTAYNKATAPQVIPAPSYQLPTVNLDNTLKLYLGVGAVALVAWIWLMRK